MDKTNIALVKKDLSLLARETEAKINKWDYINQKAFQSEGILEQNEKATDSIGENICKQYIL